MRVQINRPKLLLFGLTTSHTHKIKCLLCSRFKIKDLGTLPWFLGIGLKWRDGYVKMSLMSHIKRVLQESNMTHCKLETKLCGINATKIQDEDSI